MSNIGTIPVLSRMRHETRRRQLMVLSTDHITPNMLRLRLGGSELEGFFSPSPDDHIKIFVSDGQGGSAMRDYTPRRFNPEEGWLEIDFALHDAGPATHWARQVRVGHLAEIGGPRGSTIIGGPITGWLLIGDETALPAIARRIEQLPQGTPVISLVTLSDPADQQKIETSADHRPYWIVREDPANATALLSALDDVSVDEGVFIWIAAEAGVARTARDRLLERGIRPEWMRAAGYWMAGKADSAVKDL